MKKKKIFLLTLAMVASFGLASCGNEKTNETNNENKETVTEKDRGVEDKSKSDIKLPDVGFEEETNPNPSGGEKPIDDKPNYDEIPEVVTTDEVIAVDDGDYIEVEAGSASLDITDSGKYLYASANIGYNFLGWYLGDECISTENYFKADKDAQKIAAKFEVKEEFKDLIFTSTENECVLTGVKDTAPIDLVLPEGITKIATEAFKDAKVGSLTLPESLNEIEDYAFAESRLFTLKFKKVPSTVGERIDRESNIRELYFLNINDGVEKLGEYGLYNGSSYYSIKHDGDSAFVYIDDFVFTYNEGDWIVVGYLGDYTNIVFPKTSDVIDNDKYYIVPGAFTYNESIETIEFSDDVAGIYSYDSYRAFAGCTNLKSITFGKGITFIDDYAFCDCVSLNELIIPKNVTSIGYNAFNGCDGLKYVSIGDNGVDGEDEIIIESYAFYSCDNLVNILLGNNVVEIGEGAFEYCDSLYSVTLGKNLEYIGSDAFYGDSRLHMIYNYSSLTLEAGSYNNGYVAYYTNQSNIINKSGQSQTKPNGEKDNFKYMDLDGIIYLYEYVGNESNITIPTFDDKDIVIGTSIFENNKNIENVTLNEHVIQIEKNAFRGSSLKSIDLIGVKYISEYAFQNCYLLNNVKMPKVESIGYDAFEYCYSLYQIELPETLTSIGSDAFYGCNRLVEVINKSELSISTGSYDYGSVAYHAHSLVTDASKSKLVTDKNYVYYIDEDYKELIAVLDLSVKKVVIGEDISSVNIGCLYGLNELEELETNVFNNRLGFFFGAEDYWNQGIYVPQSLKKVVLLDDVTYISSSAFYNCSNLTDIAFTKNVESVGSSVFQYTNIKNVYYDGDVSDWMNISFVTYDDYSNPMKGNNVNIYFKQDGEYKVLEKVVVPNGVTSIDDYRFYGFNMSEVVLPEGLTRVGYYTFGNCKNLNKINLDSLTYIDGAAFANTSIEDVTISNDLEYLGSSAFSGTKIKKIVIPTTLTDIPANLFENCQNLQYVKIEEGVASIGLAAFKNCRSLYTLIIPSSLSSIDSYAFYGCENLEDIDLENTSVTELNNYSFAYCSNLIDFKFPANLASIYSTTFEGCDNFEATTYNNGCYIGTKDNPYRWLFKARAKTILNCTVHPSCEKIFTTAFSDCKNLKKLIIPSGCTDINGILKGLTRIETIEMPYTSSDALGYYMFGVSSNEYIPSRIKNLVINGGSIVASAFKGVSSLVSVELGEGVTSVGASAFEELSNARFKFSSTIKTVGASAFKKCSLITDISALTGLETINESAFCQTGVTAYEATSSLKTVGNYAFAGCLDLVSVDLVQATSLGDYAFSNCPSLSSVTLPTGATSIGDYAFQKCTSLKTINISSSYTEIGDYAFKDSGLETVTGMTYVVQIREGAFMGSNLKSITIPSSVSGLWGSLGKNICKGCVNLTSATFNNTFSGANMFEGCTSLATVTSTTLKTIAASAFKGCTALTSVNNLTKLTDIKENAFQGSGLTSFKYSKALNISNYAFKDCLSLETVELTHDEIYFRYGYPIGSTGNTGYTDTNYNFQGCTALKSVTLPTTMTTLPTGLFMDCESLDTFDFSNVLYINSYAFKNTGFTTLVLPDNITGIGEESFSNCSKLQSLTVNAHMGSTKSFKSCTNLTTLVIGGGNTSIPAYVFEDCTSLNSVTFNEELKEIGSYSFDNTGLTKINIPSNIISISDYAFANSKLEEVDIPVTVLTVGGNAFAHNENLLKATIRTQYNGNYLFSSCTKLKEVYLEEGIEKIQNGMFDGCTSLTTINMPSSLSTINSYAFRNCSSLPEITLPKNVTTINSYAFNGCTSLADVYNYSDLEIVKGSTNYGYVGYYATTIHGLFTDYNGETNSDGFVFTVIGGQGYLMDYVGTESKIVLPDSFDYSGTTYTEYEIYTNAFLSKKIASVVIPESVKAIGDYAFADCTKLVEIYNLSDLDLNIGSGSNGCVALNAIVIHNSLTDDSIVAVENDFAFAYLDNKGYVIGYLGDDTEIVVPGSFTYGSDTITDLTIYAKAFYNSEITSIAISDGIVDIGLKAFYGCSDLSTIELPASLHEFEANPFTGCTITKAIVPTSMIKYVNNYDSKNNALEELVISSGDTIPAKALYENTKLKKVTLPNTITTIEEYAFYSCSALEEINLPDSLVSIGERAFYSCSKLVNVVIPTQITSLPNYVFYSCSGLRTVMLPTAGITIAEYAFYGCTGGKLKVFCAGTKDEFGSLNIMTYNSSSYGKTYANVYYYSEEAPSFDKTSNLWHYDTAGKPVEYNLERAYSVVEAIVSAMKECIEEAINNPDYEYVTTSYSNDKVNHSGGWYTLSKSGLKSILTKTGDHADLLAILNTSECYYTYIELQYKESESKYNYRVSSGLGTYKFGDYRLYTNPDDNYSSYKLELDK